MAGEPLRTLVLLRHGRTAWNGVGRAQGHADVPLDDVGRLQAERAARALSTLQPVALWSSDLIRARETAQALSEACGVEVVEDPRLREFDVGQRQGLTWEESVDRFPWIAGGRSLGDHLVDVPGAEDDGAVADRVLPALEAALAALGAGQTGVVVGHGAAHKIGLVGLLGWDPDVIRSLRVLGNGRWATVEVAEGGPRRLAAYGVGDVASP